VEEEVEEGRGFWVVVVEMGNRRWGWRDMGRVYECGDRSIGPQR
jgi:hypothetical protein